MQKNLVPFRLEHNRMSYLIPGGFLIDRFLGEEEGKDPMASQMWIASVVQTALKGDKDGCSRILKEDGGGSFPERLKEQTDILLGHEFAEKFGPTPGFLLKLLNSDDRLLVQVHPDKEKARKYFGQPFGKTEAWYVMDTDQEEPAYIWAGFKEEVTPEGFRKLIEIQDTEGILNQLHRFEVHPGDVILVPAGLPHALGNHSLVAEIQEPVDLTLRAERFRPDGSEMSVESLHSGIGMDGLLDCFEFRGENRVQTRNRIFIKPEGKGDSEEILIGPKQTKCFGMSKLTITGNVRRQQDSFAVGLVLSGEGMFTSGEKSFPLEKGTEFFVPACVDKWEYHSESGKNLVVLECYPPENDGTD